LSDVWSYVLADPARRDLRRLDRTARERIFAALDRLIDTGVGDVRKLAGREAEWRLRVGDYRIVFERDNQQHRLVVLRVRHRQDAYKD
jgi:mRNA interferase RelE/StbE